MRSLSGVRRYRLHELSVRVTEGSRLGVAFRGGSLLLLVFSASVVFVWLRSSTERFSRELQAYQEEFRDRGREYENLRVEYESFTSREYILRRVADFPAGRLLHPHLPGQVRRVAVPLLSSDSAVEEAAMLARR